MKLSTKKSFTIIPISVGTSLPLNDLNLEGNDEAKKWLSQNEFEDPEDQLLLRRVIYKDGKSKAFINGIHDAGLPCVGKHFPGHGSVAEDSHIEHPMDYRSLEEIALHDLVPFQKLSPSLDAIMPAHMTFPKIDKKPVTYSSFWLKTVLRKNFQFKLNKAQNAVDRDNNA